MHETIWGGSRLNHYVKKEGIKTGHLYLVNGHRRLSNKVLNGRHAGAALDQIFPAEKGNWGMDDYEQFPLTIALVDAKENLSIQVHPDDQAARKLEKKSIGKTESWLFLEEPENQWIYAGCTCSTEEELREAVENENMEFVTARFPVKKDDYVSVAAGTLHALTAGSLVYEIEYGSDYTYRFYDYNRTDDFGNKRELHISKACESIRFGRMPKKNKSMDGMWMEEKNYAVCRMKNHSSYKNTGNQIECVSILDGSGQYEGIQIYSGMAALLLPGETLDNVSLKDIIVARLK
ncbi:MAG: hypothetical protein HFG71_00330 [Hungatella sp.]|nr:hypothetical protein [Hungatella sp.]